MNKKMFSFALMAVFILSVSSAANMASAESVYIETNFELFYYTQSGARSTESYALYVKQALAPLGIDVRIFAKPWGQFVGELLHATTGRPFDFAHVRFGGGTPTPDFGWHYASDQYFGSVMLQLNDPDWQEWQEQDIGYTAAEIDDMIYGIDYEMDLAERLAKYDAFNQFYFDNLLYDLPVVARNFRTAVWKGYGGPNNELWDPQEGLLTSRSLGATWESNEPERAAYSNTTNMRFSAGTPQNYNLDPYQSDDSEQTALTSFTHTSLLLFDRYNNPHPDLAWNYYIERLEDAYDHDNNASTPAHDVNRLTYLLRDDAYWSATTDKNGAAISADLFDANDMVFAYDLMMAFLASSEYEISFEADFAPVIEYSASTTLSADDTFTISYDAYYETPDDYIKYGAWVSPLPDHILGGTLTYNETLSGPVEVGMNFNPWDSEEWDHWESFEGSSLVGPYEMTQLVKGEYYDFRARSDYYFPNEWDVDAFYDGNDAEIIALETASGFDLSVFAPYAVYDQEAYYWAFAGTESDMVKPTSQGIESYTNVIIDDTNTELIQFEAGAIDAFGSTALGAETVAQHTNDPRFVVKTIIPNRGPELLVFNLLNPHLKKINVRKAISHALDRDTFVKIHDGFAMPWYGLAYPNSGEFDNVQATGVDYNYHKARDLMRLEQYQAADDNTVVPTVDVPDVTEVISLGIPGFEFWSVLFAAFVTVPILRRRK